MPILPQFPFQVKLNDKILFTSDIRQTQQALVDE